MRRVGLITAVLLVLFCAPASAQVPVLSPPFDGSYSISDLGAPAGVPTRFGGLTLKAGTTDKLLLGGAANGSDGALYEVTLARDPQGHISGFVGTATRAADAAYNDGGVIYGPGNVLFLARWPNNELGQTKPGSAVTDKIIPLTPLGIESSLASLLFVPSGLPGAGRLKLASYSGGAWYDATVSPDGSGTYDLVGPKEVTTSRLSGGPEGFVYVARGSAQFPKPSLIVSEYGADQVATYDGRLRRRPDRLHAPHDDHRARRRGGRVHRPGHRRLPVLHVRQHEPGHRRARASASRPRRPSQARR